MSNENKTLCSSCATSIWCETWGQYKCTIKERHITGRKSTCASYKKRDKNFKVSRCQCDDCLENPELSSDEEE